MRILIIPLVSFLFCNFLYTIYLEYLILLLLVMQKLWLKTKTETKIGCSVDKYQVMHQSSYSVKDLRTYIHLISATFIIKN